MIQKLLKIDDNLLSFLCGIISNIPISIIFTIHRYGETLWENTYFFLWIGAFIFSVALTCSAFMFTLRKIKIQKELEKSVPVDRDTNFDRLYKENKSFLVKTIKAFFIFAIVLILLIIALWIITNFLK